MHVRRYSIKIYIENMAESCEINSFTKNGSLPSFDKLTSLKKEGRRGQHHYFQIVYKL